MKKLVSFLSVLALGATLWTSTVFALSVPDNYKDFPAVLYQVPINTTVSYETGHILEENFFRYGWIYYKVINETEKALCTPDGELLTYDQVQSYFNPNYVAPVPTPKKTLTENTNQNIQSNIRKEQSNIENKQETKKQAVPIKTNTGKTKSQDSESMLLSSGDYTLGRLIGDISRGNHPQAPYANSKIIVPRPFHSQFAPIPKAASSTNFTDIKGHWAENDIKRLTQNGYIAGFSDGTFRPDAPVTYAEFATIFSRFGFKPVRFDNVMQYDLIDVFSKFDRKADYFNALLVADEAGLWGNHVKLGYEVGFMSNNRKPDTIYGSLNSEENATRQYVALFLANLVERQDSDNNITLHFTDTASINANSDGDIINAVKRLVNNKILSNQGTFRPNNNITRGELAVMLCKIMDTYQWDIDTVSDNLYGNYRQYFWEQDEELMKLVNEARIAGGVQPVVYNADLQAICEIKNIDKTINGFDSFGSAHTCSYGTMDEMRKQFGFPTYIGENAAAGIATPEYVGQTLAENAHNGWTNSEGHRKNYMDANHRYGGFSLGEGFGYEGLAYGK